MTGMGEHNMKNGKLSGLRLTPLAVVIVVGMVVLGTELLFMLTLHELLIPLAPFELPDIAWDFIDAITLTAVVTPLFYFLVFRSMENEERFRQTLATAPNAIVIVDEQGRITDWNLAAQRMFGYSREEAVGQTMHQLIAPHRFHDDAVRGFAHFEESGSGPLIGKTTEVAALRKDGSEFPVEVSISALKLKGHWHAVGIIHDITERKQAEELVSAQLAEIKRARLDWQAVFDSISHPIFLHDGEFRVIRANRAYAEQAGKSFQEIIGQPYYEAFPKSDKPMPCCLRAMEKAEEEEEEEEVAVGAAIYRSRSFAVRNEQGAYLYSVHILEDITGRKQADRQKHLEGIRLSASLQINSMVGADEKAVLDFILEEGLRITDSRYAFIGGINEDASVMTIHSWSSEVMETCAVEQPPIKFPIDKAGIWAEPVRNRKAIIINDYAQPHPQKHGYPPGHVEIRRYLGVPIFDGDRVAMVAAVANKSQEYDEADVAALSSVMTDAWRVIRRNRAEQELCESEGRFHHLFENMNSGVAVYQTDAACEAFTLKSFNQAAERIERVKREEVLGRNVEEVFPGVRAFGLLEVFRRVCRSGEAERFPPAFYQDERISGWRENYVYRLDSGEIVAVYDDVTERKQTEEELRLRAQLLDGATDSIFVSDFDGNFVYLNEAAWKLRGYTRDELMAINLHTLDTPEYARLVESRIRDLMEKGHCIFESAHRRKDGSVMPIEVSARIIESGGRKLVLAATRDVTERKQAEQKKLEAGVRLKDALEDAVGAIAATLEQRDPYTAGHQRRVAQLAAVIGEEMGLAREVIEGIHFGGLIHDLGKISVPAEILGKPGRLTDTELGLIKVHAEAGYQIVKDIAFPWPVADMVRQHHERLDGSGYPQGLKGDEIVLEARILAVADVVEAMSANRPYRPGFGTDAALEEITRGRGTQLDAMAVDACLRIIREKGFVFTK